MAELEPAELIGTQPAQAIDLLIRHERVTAAARLAMIARAEEMHPWQREGFRSFEEWLAAREGTSRGQARRKTRTARRLRDHDRTADALADGEISEDEAEVIADAADKNPDAEHELLDTATNENRSHKDLHERAGRAKAAGEDEQARADRLRRGRRAGWGIDSDGFWTFSGRFQPEIGAEMKARLAAEIDHIFNAARQAGTREPHDRYRADAVTNLILGHPRTDTTPAHRRRPQHPRPTAGHDAQPPPRRHRSHHDNGPNRSRRQSRHRPTTTARNGQANRSHRARRQYARPAQPTHRHPPTPLTLPVGSACPTPPRPAHPVRHLSPRPAPTRHRHRPRHRTRTQGTGPRDRPRDPPAGLPATR